ncbi:ATPase MORC2-like [Tubulanus polymorphus]|uniref:ATPase MORC2-like n=1 Tax=Tubulanus polymorphus TaxID=672921 RepID=UPI003DA28095
MSYSTLSRAQLSFDYLHTNSTTHEFLFGALAELVDNSRDAYATKCEIYTEDHEDLRGGYTLNFLDDGEGMTPDETVDIVNFGKSSKKTGMDSQLIGMYGNGLKSGSMRIGNDFILFTKKEESLSCLFLSRTFHEDQGIDEVIVPIPSFYVESRQPIVKGPNAHEKYAKEMEIIYKYSPYKNEDEFFAQFNKIKGKSGTLVTIFNMKLLDSGQPELDIKSVPTDILLANPLVGEFDSDEGLVPERKSFRAYTSMLYVDPRMKLYIQGKKVRTQRLANCLYKPRLYKFASSRFKARSENDAAKAKDEARIAENKAREAESKSRNLSQKCLSGGTKEQRADLRNAQTTSAELRREANLKKQLAERKNRALKEPKTLNLIFGINIDNRRQDGVFVYNCSRMIKMYQKVGPQADGGVFCSGVVGVVDVPYLVLEPTHNKQDFADAKEFRHLMRAMGEHMVQYWKDVGIVQQGVTKFWENFGYVSANWKDPPSQDPKFLRKRATQVNITLQCDECLKWRILPFSSNNVGREFPEHWICSMNPDPAHNKCSTAEQKMNIQEGVLKKEIKTAEQKAKDLEDKIKRSQDELEKVKKTKTVMSSRDLYRSDSSQSETGQTTGKSFLSSPPPQRSRRTQPPDSPSPPPPSRRSFTRAPSPVRSSSARNSTSRSAPTTTPSVHNNKSSTLSSKRQQEVKKLAATSSGRKRSPSPPPPPARSKTRPAVTKAAAAPSSRVGSTRRNTDSIDEPKKKTPLVTKAAASPSATTSKRKISTTSEVNSDIDEPPTKKSGKKEEADSIVNGNLDQPISDDEIGQIVKAKLQDQWYSGVVVKVNEKNGKLKVKFDENPKDKYDKWFDRESKDLKITGEKKLTEKSLVESTSSSAAEITETPSSSSTSNTHHDEIADGYRTCLRYFLPPEWTMEKEMISGLSLQELAQFPLDDFFDHYEKGLRKLVSNFQAEALTKKKESDQAKDKLSQLRKLIAKLLKTINEDFDIDPESDSEQVDELLEACVKQALQQE